MWKYSRYQVGTARWEKSYGEKTALNEIFEGRLQRYQREADKQHTERTYHTRDKGAR